MEPERPDPLFKVVHEDAELLVINKQADLVCHPTKGDIYSSLISRVRIHLGETATPHLINRLDRETSGLVLVAKTDEGARGLRKMWEQHLARKTYLAIVHGHLAQSEGTIDAALGKDEKSIVSIKDCVRADGSPAVTHFKVLKHFERAEGAFSLVEVRPVTGKKHQIRLHLAHVGHPIVGDKMYGGDEMLYLCFVLKQQTEEQRRRLILDNQALHAGRLEFPWNGQNHCYAAEPEDWFKEFAEMD